MVGVGPDGESEHIECDRISCRYRRIAEQVHLGKAQSIPQGFEEVSEWDLMIECIGNGIGWKKRKRIEMIEQLSEWGSGRKEN